MSPFSGAQPDLKVCLAQIKTVFTEPVTIIDYDDRGEDFFIIEVNHEWIFRFPRREYSRQALEVEENFLPAFQPATTIALPQYCIASQNMGGYRKLPGVFLTSDKIKNLTAATQHTLARQLGQFLTTLHSYPLGKARSLGVTTKWADWRETISPEIFGQIMNDLFKPVRGWASQILESYFNKQYQLCVIHGDLSLPDHILLDDKLNQISGIIDFGDLTIDDPVRDFLSIYEDGGNVFFAQVSENYHATTLEGLHDRIMIELYARPIFHAAYCIETENFRKYKETLQTVCRNFRVVERGLPSILSTT
ncbi:MAG: phosphotransferase [Anaerolineaceae bacterium]